MIVLLRLITVLSIACNGLLQGQSVSEETHVVDLNRIESFPSLLEVRDYMRFLATNKLLDDETVGTVFVSGGFSSCHPRPGGVEVYKTLMEHLWKRAAVGEYYRIVAGCFSLDNSPIYYINPENPELTKPGDLESIALLLNQQIKLSKSPNVFIVGHSYGGWLGQKLALKLSDEANLIGMITMDPISTVHCSPEAFVYAYLTSVFTQSPDPECNKAPSDISESDLESIAARSQWWMNFYQTNSSYLHSSAIPGAENHYIHYTFDSPLAVVSAHGAIDTDERVWQILSPKFRVFE